MGLREEIQRKIDRKHDEIRDLELKVREAHAYVQAMMDMLKMLPREVPENPDLLLRPGTMLAGARDAIRKAGKPLHISMLLAALGKPDTRNNRAALGGSLSTYVRRRQIFTRPAPNTFGLLELEQVTAEEPPDSFGIDSPATDADVPS